MLIKPDCIPCILRMAMTSARQLLPDERDVEALFPKVMDQVLLKGQKFDLTSPELIAPVMKLFIEFTRDEDPFFSIKELQNEKMGLLTPYAFKLINSEPDPFLASVKLSILGNSIDVMIDRDVNDTKQFVRNKMNGPICRQTYKKLIEKLETSKKLLYISDNCGEIVFDRFLIKMIKERYPLEIMLLVRGNPALNDVTKNDAIKLGLDQMVTIIDNGCEAPIPGTVIQRCNPRVKALFQEADIIISKGGGNFDTLEAAPPEIRKKIFFLLLSKCDPLVNYFHIPVNEMILGNLSG